MKIPASRQAGKICKLKIMTSPYQKFAQKARERFLERQKRKANGTGQYVFTLHAQYKMKQYGLSEQKVRSVIRHPQRTEEGIVKQTVAVMQPVSVKKAEGKEVWKQEIWVMYQLRGSEAICNFQTSISQKKQNTKYKIPNTAQRQLRIISAWRYPGVSPKRNPIPDEILRELEDEATHE